MLDEFGMQKFYDLEFWAGLGGSNIFEIEL